jgi:hypothetical protein
MSFQTKGPSLFKRKQFGGKGDNERALTTTEVSVIRKVFQHAPLPSLLEVTIADGVNGNGGAWTDSDYQINVGKTLYSLDLGKYAADTLVHEMVHVWQYKQGTLSKAKGFGMHALFGVLQMHDRLYNYKIGDSWNDLGFEGQAQLVEDWYAKDGMSTNSLRYIYVKVVLQSGDDIVRTLSREELMKRPEFTKVPEVDMTRPEQPGTGAPLVHPFEQLLDKRFQAGDPAALARVEKLKLICRETAHPKELLARLKGKRPGDKMARLFYEVLAHQTIAMLLKILEERVK